MPGRPTAALPVSATRMASARRRSAFAGTNCFQPTRALFLGSFDDHLEVDRDVVAESMQRGEMRDDVALAVGRTSAVPAAVDVGEAERRGAPVLLVQRWLHVVVGVQQDGRGVAVRARP